MTVGGHLVNNVSTEDVFALTQANVSPSQPQHRDHQALADNVRRHRRNAGLTQGELAEEAGVSLRTIIKVETGRANPTLSNISAIAQVLNTTPASLLETTTMQELIIAIKTAADLDQLTNAINDLADHVDGLDLDDVLLDHGIGRQRPWPGPR
ncbi:MAG: helix-turn-helix transcriptional regulator [Brevundimonas sp.]|nr:helix-turn-helix transcriptional regulator [Brevundimonas sp.]